MIDHKKENDSRRNCGQGEAAELSFTSLMKIDGDNGGGSGETWTETRFALRCRLLAKL